jgi:hypothetical protein
MMSNTEHRENSTPFHITLVNRLHAVWEKSEALAYRIDTANDGWLAEGRPTTAPRSLRTMADGFLALAVELDALARDVEVEDKRFAESTSALQASYAEAMGMFERDRLVERFGEIVRTPPMKRQAP